MYLTVGGGVAGVGFELGSLLRQEVFVADLFISANGIFSLLGLDYTPERPTIRNIKYTLVFVARSR